MCYVSGLDHVPVCAGATEPLFVERKAHCPEIHGDTGLDGSAFPTVPLKPVPENCSLFIHRTITSSSEPVTLVCTGCLTNAAILLKAFPDVVHNIKEIVIMGGAMGVGNTGPVSEFNIQIDPEAAKIVFESGLKVTMVPLEVTHTVLVTPSVQERIATMVSRPFLLFANPPSVQHG
mmetsp:Transcript_58363/g.137534  ORF Transcript_58363/g.137534 Transcript_58363/m.137534 type:complete len:176 (-) Transcript_58363:402-929(-)